MAFLDRFRGNDLMDNITGYARDLDLNSVLLPSLAAAGGGAALGYGLTPERSYGGEPSSSRRKRKLRNALIGAGLAGGTAAAVPTGLRLLSTPTPGAVGDVGLFERGVDSAANVGISNLLPVAGLAGYGYMRSNQLRGRSDRALKELRGITGNMAKSIGSAADNHIETINLSLSNGAAKEKAFSDILDEYNRLPAKARDRYKHIGKGELGQLLQQVRDRGIGRSLSPFNVVSSELRGPAFSLTQNDLLKRIPGFLKDTPAGDLANRAVASGPVSKILGNDAFQSAYARLGKGRMASRMGRLGMLGAGVAGLKVLQDRMTGN